MMNEETRGILSWLEQDPVAMYYLRGEEESTIINYVCRYLPAWLDLQLRQEGRRSLSQVDWTLITNYCTC